MRHIFFIFQFITICSLAQTPVSFQELGLRFDSPKGWSGQIQDEYYIMGHETLPGLMILIQNSSSSADELKSLAMQGIYDEGVRLKPTSEFSLVGNNKIEGFYEGNFNGSNVKCFAIGLINSKGSGLSILVLTTLQAFTDTHISEAKKLASSVEFFESSDTQMTLKWKQQIINTQLKYMSTYTSTDYSGGYAGTSHETIIKLFPNMTFTYYSNSNASFSTGDVPGGFGYSDATRSNKGIYKIYSIGRDTYLELHFADDRIYEYSLTKSEDGSTLLNGDRYFLIDINE